MPYSTGSALWNSTWIANALKPGSRRIPILMIPLFCLPTEKRDKTPGTA